MPFPELRRILRDQTLHRRLSNRENSLKSFDNVRDATNMLARRIKNMQIRLAKKHIQININKLRDRKQIVSELVHKSDIIQGEAVIYLDDTSTEHLTLLIIHKSHILLVW
jgi:anionic cell wall polymer biosynthesis LytR-Cps2A-Psr (LCP) family protein